jgi:hypothetical protein
MGRRKPNIPATIMAWRKFMTLNYKTAPISNQTNFIKNETRILDFRLNPGREMKSAGHFL